MKSIKLNKNRLQIFHEARKRKFFVGELIYDEKNDKYELIYNKHYANSKTAIPISPELSLFKLKHSSKGKLFSAFLDRIPEKSNPAYATYCKSQGISPNEKNLLVLLGAIGRRGPSSFVFEAVYGDEFKPEDVAKWRAELNISQHDFSEAFDISRVTLQKIESGESRDANTLKRIEVLCLFPEVAIWQLKKTGGRINREVLERLIKYFNQLEKTDLI